MLAKRMARVCASGSPSLTSAEVFHTQLLSLPTFGESFMSGTTVKSYISLYFRTDFPAHLGVGMRTVQTYYSGWRKP